MFSEINKIMLLLALVLAALLGNGAYHNWKILSEKIKAQQASTDALMRWKAAYEALLPVKKQWAEMYRDTSSVKDVYAIYKIIDFEAMGLSSDADKLFVEKVEKLPDASSNIGMNALCLGNSSAPGVQVFANDHDALVHGLQKLAQHKDLRFSSIIIDGKDEKAKQAKAVVTGMCLLVRDIDNFK
jgi:hypothetical protein